MRSLALFGAGVLWWHASDETIAQETVTEPDLMPMPANKEALRALVAVIMKDVCELDPTGKWNRDDNPARIVMTVAHLELILNRHLCGEE